jgi:NADH-quinone oxidoreductase subunit G
MIEIEIDGKSLEVEQGSMIIEVADKHGIPIPRFCYHKKLSIAANCRMCLVEVEKAPKPLPACATPVTAGMKVRTCSAKARDAQKAVMEFLLINHPLDCPICDQGGECELQDLSLGYGRGISRFNIGKRSVKDDDLGPLIATEMTRCIQCTRCVRFGQEVAGIRELGATGRGEDMQITTYIQHSLESEMSGNIIDLCPVGALTSKPFRFTARAWELKQTASIAPHDCVGSNVYVHTRRNDVMRVVPRENETLNETWLSDRDRYSYLAVRSAERLQQPMIKLNSIWQEVDWATALEFAVDGLQKVLAQYGAKQIGALASPSATTEELFLLQKLMRGMGSHNIDHRLHQADFTDQKSAPLYPTLGIKIEELENQDTILLIGSNIQREQPIAGHRVRKASLRGAKILSVNLIDHVFNFSQSAKIIVAPNKLTRVLAGIAKALAAEHDLLKEIQPTAEEQVLAEQLKSGQKKIILLGALAQNHPDAAIVRALAQLIADVSQAQVGYLTEGANSAGAWLAGAIPHRGPAGVAIPEGLTANTALAASLHAYLLFGIEPELDCANPLAALNALSKAEFVIAFSPFKSERYLQYANVILPIAQFAETAGTLVNCEGRWQSFLPASNPPGEVRPGWKVLRVLANQLNIPGFEYAAAEEVRDELQKLLDQTGALEEKRFELKEIKELSNQGLTRITEWPIYSIDSVTRRAPALQASATHESTGVYINADLAARLHLQEEQLVTARQGSAQAQLPVIIDARIPDDCVWIPAGRLETARLGAAFGEIEIHA